MSDPDVKAVSLYNLFHDKTYVVPQFQRGYAWESEQVNDLLVDLETFFNEERNSDVSYIMGQMIVAPTEGPILKSGYKLSLIDGQQRATTITLLFAAMQERFSELANRFPDEDWNSELLELRNLLTFVLQFGRPRIPRLISPYGSSDEMIEALVLGATPPVPQTRSVERILAAYQQILDYITDRFSDNERADFRHFFYMLEGRVFVVQLLVPNALDALVVFERINNRGLPLDAADLLKNLLFQTTDENSFDLISQTWQTTLEDLHKIKQKRLTSMVYLLRAIALREGQNVPQNHVYDHWTKVLHASPPRVTSPELANQLTIEAKNLVEVAAGRGPSGSNQELSAGTNHLGILQSIPILLQAWHLGPNLYSEIAKLMEERVVLFALARERTAAFEHYVPTIMREISLLDSSSTKNDVRDAFAMAESKSDRDDLLDRARLGVLSLSYSKAAERKRQRYVLSRISRAAQNAGGMPVVSWADFLRRPTNMVGYHMDHVYPQGVQGGPIKKHSIGNLVLLEAPLNSGLGAALPANAVKQGAYINSGLFVNQILAGATSSGRPAQQGAVIDHVRTVLSQNLLTSKAINSDPGQCLEFWDDESIEALAETYWQLFRADLGFDNLP